MSVNINKEKVMMGQLFLLPAQKAFTEKEFEICKKLDMNPEELCEMDLQIATRNMSATIHSAKEMGMGFDVEDIFDMIKAQIKALDKHFGDCE